MNVDAGPPFTGGGNDLEVAWTLGRELWEHFTKNRFAFPGEKDGVPERMVFHDVGHVLAGYDAQPESEIQQGALQGGFTPLHGPFRRPEGPARRAAWRALLVDLSDHFDLFAVADAPVEQLRAEYGIPRL